jgi:hypothetical protein
VNSDSRPGPAADGGDDAAWNAVLAGLVRGCRDAQPDELPALVNAECAALGFEVTLYLVDHEQRHLWPVPETGRPTPAPLPLPGTPGGRAFISDRTQRSLDRHDNVRLWVPLADGADRLGVAEMRGRTTPQAVERLQRNAEAAVALLAYLIKGKLPHGDVLHQTRRTRPMRASGELLLSLVPPLSFRCRRVLITSILEPCYDVGGDAYDYAVDGSTASFMIIDSMGRGMQAALTSAAVLATTRAARREGADLAEMARAADDALAEQFGNLRFATGVLARLDTIDGRLRYLNAGHPAPILIRPGQPARMLTQGRRLPLGLADGETVMGETRLEPSDRVLLYTDGVTDPRDRDQPATGAAWLAGAAQSATDTGLAASEALRLLARAVISHDEQRRADDATLMLVEWSPAPTGRD